MNRRAAAGTFLLVLLLSHAGRDAVTEIFVDLAPIVQGPRENGFGNPLLEVPDDIAHQPCARRVCTSSTPYGLCRSCYFLDVPVGRYDRAGSL